MRVKREKRSKIQKRRVERRKRRTSGVRRKIKQMKKEAMKK